MTPTQRQTNNKEQKSSWNVWVMLLIGLIGVATSQVDRLFGQGQSAGALETTVKAVCDEVKRIDESGSKRVGLIDSRVGVLEEIATRNKADIAAQNAKLDKIIELLTTRPK